MDDVKKKRKREAEDSPSRKAMGKIGFVKTVARTSLNNGKAPYTKKAKPKHDSNGGLPEPVNGGAPSAERVKGKKREKLRPNRVQQPLAASDSICHGSLAHSEAEPAPAKRPKPSAGQEELGSPSSLAVSANHRDEVNSAERKADGSPMAAGKLKGSLKHSAGIEDGEAGEASVGASNDHTDAAAAAALPSAEGGGGGDSREASNGHVDDSGNDNAAVARATVAVAVPAPGKRRKPRHTEEQKVERAKQRAAEAAERAKSLPGARPPRRAFPKGAKPTFPGSGAAAVAKDAATMAGGDVGGAAAKPRLYTLSIAVPGSVVDNAQSRELKTCLVGQIARAAAIYQVDEIVVYDDMMGAARPAGGVPVPAAGGGGGGYRGSGSGGGDGSSEGGGSSDPNVFMARLLQYLETPQYLRRPLFPMHPDLRFAGLLAPLDAPHHVRVDEAAPFREGVVIEGKPPASAGGGIGSGGDGGGGGGSSGEGGCGGGGSSLGNGSLVNIGLRRPAVIDRAIRPGVRVTVRLVHTSPAQRGHPAGSAVAPSTPRTELGLYWGYTTRLAASLSDVTAECPFPGGYDLTVGTSERGTASVDDPNFKLPTFRHALIVFGGVAGIEASVDADETSALAGENASSLFDLWVNTCPEQGSRTIRTEEAVLLSLARLRPAVARNVPPP